MSFWEILDLLGQLADLLNFLIHWRFTLAMMAGGLLGCAALVKLDDAHLGWAIAGPLFLAGVIAGSRWQSASERIGR